MIKVKETTKGVALSSIILSDTSDIETNFIHYLCSCYFLIDDNTIKENPYKTRTLFYNLNLLIMKLKKINLKNVSEVLSEQEMKNITGGSCQEISSGGCEYYACLGAGGVWYIQYTIRCWGK